MTLQRFLAGLPLVTLALFPGPAAGGSLEDLARNTEAQGQVASPLRADIRAKIDGLEGKRDDSLVFFVRKSPDGSGVDLLLDFQKAKERYLILADGTARAARNGKVQEVPLDATVAGTSWTVEDLRPFTVERCGVMRNIDESTRQMTILCNPEKGKVGQYTLSVYKVDREKAVPIRVLYYQERYDNLVKMMKSSDFELVGRKWRPTRMVMENFKLRTKDVFEASWTQAPGFPPELFDPSSFAEAQIPEAPKTAAARPAS